MEIDRFETAFRNRLRAPPCPSQPGTGPPAGTPADRQRLVETVERIRPRLVVLDPLVRLHGVDENTVAEVAPILGFLRVIRRGILTPFRG